MQNNLINPKGKPDGTAADVQRVAENHINRRLVNQELANIERRICKHMAWAQVREAIINSIDDVIYFFAP